MDSPNTEVEIPVRLWPVEPCSTGIWKARIGMIDLASGLTGEEQMHAIFPSDALLLTSRILNSNEISLEALGRMQSDLQRCAGSIVPEQTIDAMMYCCTSAAIAIGEEKIERAIQEVRPGVPVTNPFSAAVLALKRLSARRISVLAPYSIELTRAICSAFAARDFEISTVTTYGLELDSEICQVSTDTIWETALQQDTTGADALFISCTGLRVVNMIERLEERIGIPVVTSNQAMAWHALSLCGYDKNVPGFGVLMRSLIEE